MWGVLYVSKHLNMRFLLTKTWKASFSYDQSSKRQSSFRVIWLFLTSSHSRLPSLDFLLGGTLEVYTVRMVTRTCVRLCCLVRGKLPTDQYIKDVTTALRFSDRKARIGPGPFVANSRLLSPTLTHTNSRNELTSLHFTTGPPIGLKMIYKYKPPGLCSGKGLARWSGSSPLGTPIVDGSAAPRLPRKVTALWKFYCSFASTESWIYDRYQFECIYSYYYCYWDVIFVISVACTLLMRKLCVHETRHL